MAEPAESSVSRPPIEFGRLFARLSVIAASPLALGLLAIYAGYFVFSTYAQHRSIDFNNYYVSSLAMRRGLDPYAINLSDLAAENGIELAVLPRAANTPFFTLIFEPLTLLPISIAFYSWFILNVTLLVATLRLLLRKVTVGGRGSRRLLVAMILLYPPLIVNFGFNQTQVIVLFLLTAMTRMLEDKRDFAAGISLGSAVLLRVYPALILVYLALRRQWRALGAACATIATGIAASFAIIGKTRTLDYALGVRWVTSPTRMGQRLNISISAFLDRLFFYLSESPLHTSLGAGLKITTAAFKLAFVGLAIRATLRYARRDDPDWRALSFWLATIIMVTPIAWIHYMTVLILPFAMIYRAALEHRTTARAWNTAILSGVIAWAALILYVALGLADLQLNWSVDNIWKQCAAELSFASLVVACLSIWWFVTDRVADDRGASVA